MICDKCRILMEFQYTLYGRGRHDKEVFKCPVCNSRKYKRGRLIRNIVMGKL